jgi:hypothetical protein
MQVKTKQVKVDPKRSVARKKRDLERRAQRRAKRAVAQ